MPIARTVLLVDDELGLLEAMAFALRRHGFQVVTGDDGAAAAEIVRTRLPDLAIVDMMLPGTSGFQVAQLVKARSDGRVPVLMISGNHSPAHRDYAAAVGIDAFLPKPFALAALTRTADRLCPPARFGAPSEPAFASPPALAAL